MASTSKNKGIPTAFYWAGGMAATVAVYYYGTRYLKERDELMEMRLMQRLRDGKSNPELPEADD